MDASGELRVESKKGAREVTDQKSNAEAKPLLRRSRTWLVFFAGIALGCLLPYALAFFYGPKSDTFYEDPLTGRRKRESIWLGVTLSDQIEENEVSKWADQNSAPGIYYAQYGWTQITREERGWFTSASIACGGGHDIPARIFRKEIAIKGLTSGEALQKYQGEIVTEFQEHYSTIGTQQKWAAKRIKK